MNLQGIRKLFPFMLPRGEQAYMTEHYVAVPPALTITDERNQVWTIGFQMAPSGKSPDGEFAFNVLRNGMETGTIASRIERRNGRIRAFTREGWRHWNGNSFI
jgi:hypothetical protein